MLRAFIVSLTLGLAGLYVLAPAKAEANYCFSQTVCPWGGMIQCETVGGPFAACGFYTVPGWSVQCIGYDAWGRWVNLFFHC
jgi:hypothetical protein